MPVGVASQRKSGAFHWVHWGEEGVWKQGSWMDEILGSFI